MSEIVPNPNNPHQDFLQLTWEEIEPALRLVLTALDIANHQGEAYAEIVRAHGLPAYANRIQNELPQLKLVFPVLQTRTGKNEASARIQAATMLYHDLTYSHVLQPWEYVNCQ